MRLVNLTPHDINIVCGKETLKIQGSGIVARVSMTSTEQRAIRVKSIEIPVVFNKPGKITGLPDPSPNTVYIVSGVVLGATNRADVYAPDTGETAIRDEDGKIKAVTRLRSCCEFEVCETCEYFGMGVMEYPYKDSTGDLCPRCPKCKDKI